MPILYPEGGMPGLTLRQRQRRQEMLPIDTFKVQLVPLRPAPKMKINNPEDVQKVVKEMGDYDREVAKVIHLDTKNQVMGVETISVGSLSASIVHPRETVKGAILNNSANVIFVHNHPSGICPPSDEDMGVTKALIAAFNQVGITLLDSVVVGKNCYFSFKEHGLMPSPIPQAGFQEVREPDSKVCVTSDTPEKVEFISAMTDYITAPDLERRKRAAEKLRASRYFKEWADTLFYERDTETARKDLMRFLGANEEGLGFVNYTYFGVISEYLGAISKPVTESRIGEHVVKDAEIKPQTLLPHARVIEKINKWTVEEYIKNNSKEYAISDGTHLYFLDILPSGEAIILQRHDDPFEVPKYVKKWIKENFKKISEKVGQISENLTFLIIPPSATGEPSVIGTRKEGELFVTQVSYQGKIYSGWGATPERSVKNAKENALSAFTVSEQVQPQKTRIEVFLEERTLDTGKYSATKPIPESALTGVAIPTGRYLVAFHVTDDPVRVLGKLQSGVNLCEANPSGDMGCGFYVSGVPEYWYVRSTAKYDFAKKLTKDQRQDLYDVIMKDPRYRKGGGYIADFEIERLRRDLRNFVETGDIAFLASAYGQPYNVRVTSEMAKQARIPAPGVPRVLRVVLTGKFISADGLYSNPEIIRAAQAWAVVNRPRSTMQISGRQNIINAWLNTMGYAGAFTKSGMTTNPEMVVWDRRALVDVKIEEPKG